MEKIKIKEKEGARKGYHLSKGGGETGNDQERLRNVQILVKNKECFQFTDLSPYKLPWFSKRQ